MDVDDPPRPGLHERRGEDPHVPGEHDQVDLLGGQQVLHRPVLGGWIVLDGDVVVRHAEELAELGVVRVVRGDERDVGVQLARVPPREQVDQAVRRLGGEHGDPRPLVGEPELDVHVELRGDGGERLEDAGPLEREALELELDPLEEHAVGAIGVLLGVDDVAAVAPHEVGDGRDDARSVRAGEQQHGGGAHRRCTLPGPLRDSSDCTHRSAGGPTTGVSCTKMARWERSRQRRQGWHRRPALARRGACAGTPA